MTTISLDEVGRQFVQAIANRDFPAIRTCFADDVQFRALVPRGLREATGAVDATGYFQTWFASAERIEALNLGCDMIGDRQHLAWRLRVHRPTDTTILEQHAFATWDGARITHFDLVCSGFRPLEAVDHVEVAAVLDGGEQGCATLVSGAATLNF
jgi:hypothetical protein